MASVEGISWREVSLPTYEAAAFSPHVEADFSGVALWAPERVSLGDTGGRLPVAGTIRLAQEELDGLGIADRHPVRAAVVGAIVANSNDPYVGNAVTQAPLFPAGSGPVVTEHFNVDLFEATGLRPGPGRFFVFASVGPHVAKTVAVEVVA